MRVAFLLFLFSGSVFAQSAPECARFYGDRSVRYQERSAILLGVSAAAGLAAGVGFVKSAPALMFSLFPAAAGLSFGIAISNESTFANFISQAISEYQSGKVGSGAQNVAAWTNHELFDSCEDCDSKTLSRSQRSNVLREMDWQPLKAQEALAMIGHLLEIRHLCTPVKASLDWSRWLNEVASEIRAVRSASHLVTWRY